MPFAVNLARLPIRLPEITGGKSNSPKSLICFTRKRPMLAFAASNSPEEPPPNTPGIELEFIGPKVGVDGKYPVDRATTVNGRTVMADNIIELYATYGKVMNCGGGGSCGTCIMGVFF